MGINFVRPTAKQATWKTIRGMVAKNLIAMMMVGHPLGLIENIIHTGVDWIVNKNFCTNNKLVNVGIHLATCLSVDGLLHGTGHEIVEHVFGDHGHSHDVSSDVSVTPSGGERSDGYDSEVSSSVTDTQPDVSVDPPEGGVEVQGEEVTTVSVDEMAKRGGIWAKLQEIHEQAHYEGDGHDHSQMFGDHSHGGHVHRHMDTHHHHDLGHHDHDHGGHGVVPILGGAIIEEYGPNLYKVTKQRTQYLWDRMFNASPVTDTKIVAKSDLLRQAA